MKFFLFILVALSTSSSIEASGTLRHMENRRRTAGRKLSKGTKGSPPSTFDLSREFERERERERETPPVNRIEDEEASRQAEMDATIAAAKAEAEAAIATAKAEADAAIAAAQAQAEAAADAAAAKAKAQAEAAANAAIAAAQEKAEAAVAAAEAKKEAAEEALADALTPKCKQCSNERTTQMVTRGQTCETSPNAVSWRCTGDPLWKENNWCELSCALAGTPYDASGLPCCDVNAVPVLGVGGLSPAIPSSPNRGGNP